LGFFLAKDLGVAAAFFAYESGVFLAEFGSLDVDLLLDLERWFGVLEVDRAFDGDLDFDAPPFALPSRDLERPRGFPPLPLLLPHQYRRPCSSSSFLSGDFISLGAVVLFLRMLGGF
jgi:hypothetical protein